MLGWIKSIILWLFIEDNRKIGILYTKRALDLAKIVSKNTKTNKDDAAILYLTKQFNKLVELYDDKSKNEIANLISKIDKGSLKDLSLSIVKDGIQASIKNTSLSYNPITNKVNFKFSKSI